MALAAKNNASATPEGGVRTRAVLGRDTLLDAAEAVILRESISRLTLDAVAAQAGASKGGLTHHFPSKERLIGAMVERIVANWRADVLAAIEAEPRVPGRVPRAILKMAMDRPKDWTHACRRSSVVLIAALVEYPPLVQPMRDFHRELTELIANDGLRPGVGEAVYLAIDGLWFKWIFGLEDVAGARSRELRAVLADLIDCGCSSQPARSATVPARGQKASAAAGAATRKPSPKSKTKTRTKTIRKEIER